MHCLFTFASGDFNLLSGISHQFNQTNLGVDIIWTYLHFVHPGFLSVVGVPAMSFSDILVSAQVLPQQVDQLVNDGWTTEHFALCATSLEDFDAVMTDLFDTGLSPLHKASLRLAWKKCQSSTHQGALAPTPAVANPEVAAPAIGWLMVGDICTKAYVSER